MSNRQGRHTSRPSDTRSGIGSTVRRRTGRVTGRLPRLTGRELVTIWSVPAVLLVVHFLVQPAFDVWVRFKYVRHTVAQTAPAHHLAPEPLTPYAWAWHELTRFAHMLIHAPGAYHTHVLGNVALIVVTAWALLVALDVLGQRHRFVYLYWELVVVAPIVGSFAFDLFGKTPNGYGASTVGFAFLGIVAVVSALALASDLRHRFDERLVSRRSVRTDGGRAVSPFVWVAFFVVVLVIVFTDLLAASPATPVHQAGVVFGVLVGAVVVPLSRRS